jgi:hypothetical protein
MTNNKTDTEMTSKRTERAPTCFSCSTIYIIYTLLQRNWTVINFTPWVSMQNTLYPVCRIQYAVWVLQYILQPRVSQKLTNCFGNLVYVFPFLKSCAQENPEIVSWNMFTNSGRPNNKYKCECYTNIKMFVLGQEPLKPRTAVKTQTCIGLSLTRSF